MRRRDWSAIVAMLAVTAVGACAGDSGGDEAVPADTTAIAPPLAEPTPMAVPGNVPPGATAEMVAAGQQTFSTTCVACHGPDAKGTPLAPNLTDAEWINIGGTYDEIQGIVKTGVPTPKAAPAAMPPMGGASLTEEQIKAVASYVWSLGGGK